MLECFEIELFVEPGKFAVGRDGEQFVSGDHHDAIVADCVFSKGALEFIGKQCRVARSNKEVIQTTE